MATLKTGWMKKLIDGVYTKVFAISHAKCCYYDYANSKTVYDELGNKVNTANPSSTGTFSHNRKAASAIGEYSSTLGNDNIASETYSHAEGFLTTALTNQHAQGHYNNTTTATGSTLSGVGDDTAFVIGNGTEESRSNAFRVNYNGQPFGQMAYTTQGCDYAEYFEWQDGNPDSEDRRGYFVTLDGDKIRIAKPGDFISGIVSAWPSIIGNGDEEWRGRYILDDFGACIPETFEYEDVIKTDDGEKTVIKTGTKWKENPDYDPDKPYIARSKRPEWDAIGMLGVLAVRDDGSCQVNGFCTVADGGTAAASDTGYRVVKRVTDNIVNVLFSIYSN